MKYRTTLAVAALAATALTAILGAGTASATQLYKYTTPSANDKIVLGSEIVAAQESSSSPLLHFTYGFAFSSCTFSSFGGKIEKDTSSGVNPRFKLSVLTFTGCSEKVTVIAGGELEVQHIAGTTNGTVVSRGMEVTVPYTMFGYSCMAKTGTGITIGTLTGAKSASGQATLDVDVTITLGPLCGEAIWRGSYVVTTPTGLTVEAS